MSFMETAILNTKTRQLWSDRLISQDVLWSKIRLSISEGHFPHFCLLSGHSGNCQLALALSIAQTIFCKETNKPCGNCTACTKVSTLIHPDLHFCFPLSSAKDSCESQFGLWRKALGESLYMSINDWMNYLGEEGKSANISVKEIEQIISKLSLKPFEADKKALILWLPEYLGKESNRLLKLFEEPPPETYIILVTDHIDRLLTTVRSRAQMYVLNAVDYTEAASYIVSLTDTDESKAYSSIASTDGNIHEAIQLALNHSFLSLEFLRKMLKACYTNDVLGICDWVEEFSKMNAEEQKYFLLWIQRILSFVIRFKCSPETVPEEAEHSLMAYACKMSMSLQFEQIEQWNVLLDDALFAIERNANSRILMTDFCIKLTRIFSTLNAQY